MTAEQLIYERSERAQSSAPAGLCPSTSARWTRRWTITGTTTETTTRTMAVRFRLLVSLLASLLALPSLGWAQTTLRPPADDDPQCVGNDCSASGGNAQGNNHPAAGSRQDQTSAGTSRDRALL